MFGMSLIDPQPLFQANYIILNVKWTFNIENSKELLVWGEKRETCTKRLNCDKCRIVSIIPL